MLKKILKLTLLFMFVAGIVFYIFLNVSVLSSTEQQMYFEIDKVPAQQTALVLGALVYKDGSLSEIVKDRLDTAIELYEAEKVSKILLSGDHGRYVYDEVNAMKDYVLKKGIVKEDVFLDHAGFDTFDSLYRAREIFQIKDLIIVTQEFHLPRALYLANHLDIKAVGMVADKHQYLAAKYNAFRESLARVKAYLNLFFNSKPTFLGEAIPITGDSQASWDE